MICACDIGTTTLKAAIIDKKGKLKAFSKERIPDDREGDPDTGGTDPLHWITCLKTAVRRFPKSEREGIRAMVVCGNGPTLVPTGENGEPLSFALTWLNDPEKALSKTIMEKTGGAGESSYYLAKAYWLSTNRKRVYDNVRYFLPCPEYMNLYLTGNARAILPTPDYAPYMWSTPLIEKLELDPRLFPPFIRTGENVGEILPRIAEELGLPGGITVFAGGPDFLMALLGTAAIHEGRTCDRTGTSEGLNHCSARPVERGKLLCFPHIKQGFFNISGVINTSGKLIEWFLHLIGGEEQDIARFYDKAGAAKPDAGPIIVLPHFSRSRTSLWEGSSGGVIAGLTEKHRQEHLFMAIVESLGYAVREIMEEMEENGYRITEIRVSGEPAKYSVWNQQRADITGKTISVPEIRDAELLGGACVGFSGLGEYGNPIEAAENMVRIRERFYAMDEAKKRYDCLYGKYKALSGIAKGFSVEPG
ncbi:MAG: FGGY-family carbohydrate kinase [Spirochaetales bacterium]|nr:FGGY-family carbohydrate kinase [Spirochaetales bacterium]